MNILLGILEYLVDGLGVAIQKVMFDLFWMPTGINHKTRWGLADVFIHFLIPLIFFGSFLVLIYSLRTWCGQ